mmetsp:Transcript_18524/g.41001  ORF Transcript_18524/g.41001 Transcript_18524/m.41001 type:complete len:518 (+) Transcript_18524:1287-2840(+)
MNVDVENFEAAAIDLLERLPAADYVAVDLEMTGIHAPVGSTGVLDGDSPEARYEKCARIAAHYGMIQVGVALFTKAPGDTAGSARWVSRAYNFYVFPWPCEHSGAFHSASFAIDSSAINFNRGHAMDFGRWMSKGVSYTDGPTEDRLKEALLGQPKRDTNERVIVNRPADKRVVDQFMAEVAAFDSRKEKELKVPMLNKFLIRAIRESVEQKYPHLTIDKRDLPGQKPPFERVVLNVSEVEKEEVVQAGKEKNRKLLERIVGFRKIWTGLTQQKKPLVVHNGLYDLLFLFHWLEAPLPRTLVEFKEGIHKLFPVIYDTKTLVSGPDPPLGNDTWLEALGKRLDSSSLCELDPDSIRYAQSAAHEAGYDAWMTGKVFSFFKAQAHEPPSANLLFMIRNIWMLNLAPGKDPLIEPAPHAIFQLDSIEAGIHIQQLRMMLRPVLDQVPSASGVDIKWTGDRAALLVVKSKDAVVDESLRLKIVQWIQDHEVRGLLRGRSTTPGGEPHAKRFRPDSAVGKL